MMIQESCPKLRRPLLGSGEEESRDLLYRSSGLLAKLWKDLSVSGKIDTIDPKTHISIPYNKKNDFCLQNIFTIKNCIGCLF